MRRRKLGPVEWRSVWTPPPPQAVGRERLVEVVRRGNRGDLSGPSIVAEASGDTMAIIMFLKPGFPFDHVYSSNLRACDADDLSDQEAALLAEHRLMGKSVIERFNYQFRDIVVRGTP